jgi:hypothetical protein
LCIKREEILNPESKTHQMHSYGKRPDRICEKKKLELEGLLRENSPVSNGGAVTENSKQLLLKILMP